MRLAAGHDGEVPPERIGSGAFRRALRHLSMPVSGDEIHWLARIFSAPDVPRALAQGDPPPIGTDNRIHYDAFVRFLVT